MKLTYLGHSAFEIETHGEKILIDPFLVMSPNYNPQNVKNIFITHAHSDHLGSAIEISRKTGAKITAIFELANYCAHKGAQNINGINLGGKTSYNWGCVVAVPAFHSSSTPEGIYGGCPCGYVFNIEGKTLYHAGDTCLNSEMDTIGEFYKPDISILPIGGVYTMDIEQAVSAAAKLNSKIIVPMHYNTFDAIKVDINEFSEKISAAQKQPLVINIGSSVEI